MADIELSLDEIIKKRHIKTRPVGGPKQPDIRRKPFKRLPDGPRPTFNKAPVMDARYKIMNSQFRRVGTDARDRIEAMRKRNRPPIRRAPVGSLRPLIGQLRNALRTPMDVDIYDEPRDRPFPLMRTVDNDLPVMKRQHFDWDRPVEEDEDVDMVVERLRRNVSDPPGFRPGAPDWNHISVTLNNPRASHLHSSVPHAGILKKPAVIVPTPAIPPRAGVSLSERFNRDRNAEAAVKVEALKAQLKAAKGEATVAKAEPGHRIVVSNLVPSVTHEDVKELFADIGELLGSKLVRPGVAEVVYLEYEDAVKAVDVYHNRQLDGQPMKCLLVKNQTKKNSRPFVELDMATLRNALHKKMAS